MHTLLSPCKVNLRLKILGRRPDGYHLLESFFAPVGIYDEIALSPAKQLSVTYHLNGLKADFNDDLITRAHHAFESAFGKQKTYQIAVKKNIPIGAGLGGGSGNAGAILRFLAEENNVPLDDRKFLEVCASVGSDVPFFIQAKPALVTGVGETVAPVAVPSFHFVVIKPKFSVATPLAYSWFDADHGLDAGKMMAQPQIYPSQLSKLDVLTLLDNDLQSSVELRHPEIRTFCQLLQDLGSEGSLMSGSGSAVFGLYSSQHPAEEAYRRLNGQKTESGFSVFIGKGL